MDVKVAAAGKSPQKWAVASVTEEAGARVASWLGRGKANVPQTSGPEDRSRRASVCPLRVRVDANQNRK